MYGISTVNIELTSRCNKDCPMCGRRKLEAKMPEWKNTLGDMDYPLFLRIVAQLQPRTVVALHWNGEPTLYPYLKEAAAMVKHYAGCYPVMDTNGLKLMDYVEYSDFSSITVSVISDDTAENYERVFDNVEQFCRRNYTRLILRVLGDKVPWEEIQKIISHHSNTELVTRTLHDAEMSRNYEKPVVKPEIGVCLDLLHHLAIDRNGDVFPCVRFNPNKLNLLGNAGQRSLKEIASNKIRMRLINDHFGGRRDKNKLCGSCDFWGCPVG